MTTVRSRSILEIVTASSPKSAAAGSVVVLLKIYAHCIAGQADVANKRFGNALSVLP